ncbi:hypothetical protein M433DRAFT_426530 [Acidomyces richmondensis BFW]|nr:MAG: hypothetical protein FE78DRAFT_228900 [Acidomyces sp. 'richmondensis']KYG48358.1 hypothetical protein M433DRAFT_426530 [Acidomyces richmondensis BFW]
MLKARATGLSSIMPASQLKNWAQSWAQSWAENSAVWPAATSSEVHRDRLAVQSNVAIRRRRKARRCLRSLWEESHCACTPTLPSAGLCTSQN